MDYYKETREFWLSNLASQIKTPTLVRVDINVPVEDGRIMEDNPRLRVYGNILSIMAKYGGLVVVAHQGRKGKPGFISLSQHVRVLQRILPTDISIEFIPYEKIFSSETKERIKNLDKNEILVLDNIRFWPGEKEFKEGSEFERFFKGIVKACVNDSVPTLHRANTSLMALPYISTTFVGLRTLYELEILSKIKSYLKEEKNSVGIILGGAKIEKVSKYLPKLAEFAELYTGGIPGQVVAKCKGYNLGEKNEEFLKKKIPKEIFDLFSMLLKKYHINSPVDFVVNENGEDKVYSVEDVHKSNGMIMDIGPETVDVYSTSLQSKLIRIRGGPLGVYERGYGNGAELTRNIAGHGLVFLGGDTASELVRFGLMDPIKSAGGVICLSGGAFYHGLVGLDYPSLDLIIKQKS
ncbi:MAG: phosphoglycerate kinase [Candidatus Aenigmarchaeota archaeon]|nr:phosphoglycerate kinase [Candidatus Aenigmarchaeota archaeon]